MPEQTDIIGQKLLSWFQKNQRTLPWRATSNPYFIWLSEIILQQTRVEQGLPYFQKFVANFPEVSDLANAELDQVLKLWQGLGYYSRARNLHKSAQQIVVDFNGHFPGTYDQIKTLTGVGPYTAAAIASIAFEEPKAVVDGNVIRVISRLFGITEAVDQGIIRNQIGELADLLLAHHKPSVYNQAIMEFGALQCVPKNPKCDGCVLSDHCLAKKSNLVSEIPLKSKKTKRKSRFFHYVIAENEGKVLIDQRGEKDIWEGLFQFPLIESSDNNALDESEIAKSINYSFKTINRVNKVQKHVLSHQDIFARFYHVSLNDFNSQIFRLVSTDDLHTFAFPRLIDRYLENYDVIDGKKRH